MKKSAVLSIAVLFAGFIIPSFAQTANPNAGLEAWEKAMADWNRQNEALMQQNAADRELWLAQMKEAQNPLPLKKKVLIGLAYAGDKLITGYVNYHASRAAIRSEMPRFDARFNGVRADIDSVRQLNQQSSQQLLAATAALSGQVSDAAAAQAAGQARLSQQITDGQAALSGNLAESVRRILGGLSDLRGDLERSSLPPCKSPNPFGAPQMHPQPCQD